MPGGLWTVPYDDHDGAIRYVRADRPRSRMRPDLLVVLPRTQRLRLLRRYPDRVSPRRLRSGLCQLQHGSCGRVRGQPQHRSLQLRQLRNCLRNGDFMRDGVLPLKQGTRVRPRAPAARRFSRSRRPASSCGCRARVLRCATWTRRGRRRDRRRRVRLGPRLVAVPVRRASDWRGAGRGCGRTTSLSGALSGWAPSPNQQYLAVSEPVPPAPEIANTSAPPAETILVNPASHAMMS